RRRPCALLWDVGGGLRDRGAKPACLLWYPADRSGVRPVSIHFERRAGHFHGAIHLPDAWVVRDAFLCLNRERHPDHVSELETTNTDPAGGPCASRGLFLAAERRVYQDIFHTAGVFRAADVHHPYRAFRDHFLYLRPVELPALQIQRDTNPPGDGNGPDRAGGVACGRRTETRRPQNRRGPPAGGA